MTGREKKNGMFVCLSCLFRNGKCFAGKSYSKPFDSSTIRCDKTTSGMKDENIRMT